jgi:hypothetical protein
MSRKCTSSMSTIAAIAVAVAMPVTHAAAKPPSTVPGAEPYQTYVGANISDGSTVANVFSTDPVPADRRLVIEFVSVHMIVPAGQHPRIEVIGLVDGAGMPFDLPLAFVGATPPYGDAYRGTHQVRVYHDGNGVNGPGIFCHRNAAFQGSGICSASISGYLIGK